MALLQHYTRIFRETVGQVPRINTPSVMYLITVLTGHVSESVRIPTSSPDLQSDFLGHTFRNGRGGYNTRLRTPIAPKTLNLYLSHVLCHLAVLPDLSPQ
jgi:hypothetical protein